MIFYYLRQHLIYNHYDNSRQYRLDAVYSHHIMKTPFGIIADIKRFKETINNWNIANNPTYYDFLIPNLCIRKIYGNDTWVGMQNWPYNIDPPIVPER